MKPDLIYSKTAAGEEAMRQRTRVIQRNVRMVLILVDGQSTVADLSLKTGNQQITENALSELERGGFIEPCLEQDSIWAESKKVAQEIRTAAIDKASQFAAPFSKQDRQPSVPPSPENPVFVHSGFQSPIKNEPSILPFAISSMQTSLAPNERGYPVFSQDQKIAPVKQKSPRPKSSGPTFFERLNSRFLKRPQGVERSLVIKPLRRGQRKTMGWPATVFLGVFAVILIVGLLIVFFPYEAYLPVVETAFSQASGRPVKIGRMSVEVYPDPSLVLHEVRIGIDKNEIRAEEIRLQPALGSLMASKKSFRKAVLSGVTLPAEFISGLSGIFSSAARPTGLATVVRVYFEKSTISFGGLGIPEMDGEARLSKEGAFQLLSMRSRDRSMNLEAKPSVKGLDVSLEGFGWRPYQGSPFLFDSVNLKGGLENGAFTINTMELRLLDGLVQGAVILRNDQKPSINGDISFERLNATRLGDAFGIGQQFTGETAGKFRFLATADSWPQIFSAMNADGEFTIRRGSIRGIDLAEAVRRVSNGPIQGGATLFEQFSGKIKVTPSAYQFSGLVLNSGLMQSSGYVEVNKDFKINGKMELKMHGSVNQTRVPVSISGSLKSPTVQVGKS